MQFEPATFATYDQPVPPGGANPPSPYDPVDAAYAAARMLCANGAANGANLPAAVFAYYADPLVMPTWGEDPLWLLGFRLCEVGITRRLTVLG